MHGKGNVANETDRNIATKFVNSIQVLQVPTFKTLFRDYSPFMLHLNQYQFYIFSSPTNKIRRKLWSENGNFS